MAMRLIGHKKDARVSPEASGLEQMNTTELSLYHSLGIRHNC